MTGTATQPAVNYVGNADVHWDSFDSAAYFDNNYGALRPDDAEIITIVADFFSKALNGRSLGQAIDVGSGANLYPAMMMLPYAGHVTLLDRAFNNRKWLSDELRRPHESWWQFWDETSAGRDTYARIRNPFEVLRDRATVTKGSGVFDLGSDQFDMGTMFFVAESITTRTDEFRRAARMFVNALKPGAPFAAAFMADSSGYLVGDQFFPACCVTADDIEQALGPVARTVDVAVVNSIDLREGYGGMLVATGRKK